MAKLGAFAFVLHCHLPYCRQAGRWPHGEDWLHEAAAETYVPLLNALFDLYSLGVPARLTLDLTPILCEQLADPDVKADFAAYLDDKIAHAQADVTRFQKEGQPQRARLAVWYHDWYSSIAASFETRYSRDIVGAFRRLQDLGMVEIVTSPATHAYLPLLATEESIRAQLSSGVSTHRRHFKRNPHGVWLPECAYRPGLEKPLAREGLGLFFADAHTLVSSLPVGRAAGHALGADGCLKRNFVAPLPGPPAPLAARTTYLPCFAGAAGNRVHSGVAVIGRNERVVSQVWNRDSGYPGDKDYRDFHKKEGGSGLQYWRITDRHGDLECKDEWRPEVATQRVGEHASHFAALVAAEIRAHAATDRRYGILCASFDAELFGHWWFEGIDWLREVLYLLAASDVVELSTATEYVDQHPPTDVIALPAGSWANSGANSTWDNPETQVMWHEIHRAEKLMAVIARTSKVRDSIEAEPLLAQLARENLLLQSSDWPFLVSTGQARDYALERFNAHLKRFDEMANAIQRADFDVELADALYEQDKVFPDIDWRAWA